MNISVKLLGLLALIFLLSGCATAGFGGTEGGCKGQVVYSDLTKPVVERNYYNPDGTKCSKKGLFSV